MQQPRLIGLALICLAVLILFGNTTEALPPSAFWAGLALYPIGGYLFFKGSREAIQVAEKRASRIRSPKMKNETAERYAKEQARNIKKQGTVDDQIRGVRSEGSQLASTGPEAADPGTASDAQSIDLGRDPSIGEDKNIKVSTDVSFPIEIQEQDSLADQILKLQKLQENGIISAEEMAIAKAKLLS
jgi:hypothetical protein